MSAIIVSKQIISAPNPKSWKREDGEPQKRTRSSIPKKETIPTPTLAKDNTWALNRKVLDETLNKKLEDMMSRFIRDIAKQPTEETNEARTQQGPIEANTIAITVNLGDRVL